MFTYQSENEINVLTFGPNFAVTPKSIPIKRVYWQKLKKDIHNLPITLQRNNIRSKVINVLNKVKNKAFKSYNQTRIGINEVKKREDVVITRAEKGKASVILEKPDYENKIHALLNNATTHCVLKNTIRFP